MNISFLLLIKALLLYFGNVGEVRQEECQVETKEIYLIFTMLSHVSTFMVVPGTSHT